MLGEIPQSTFVTGTPWTSTTLLLDQTTPQTIINGTPIIPSINGSSAANGSLTLQGTSNATRTTSYLNLQPNGGNVGIGSTTANFKLQVAGTADVQGFSLNQNPGSGYVLVGTNVGVGTWMAASTLPISGGSWVNTATSALNMSGYGISNINNVGVGTITANNTLTVNNAQILGSGSANIGIGTISTGALTLNSFSTGCLTNTSGVVSSTGTACGGSAWNGTATSLLNMGGYGITNVNNVGVGTLTASAGLTVVGNVGIGTTANQTALSVMSGNVGIGTWAPTYPLQVLGNFQAYQPVVTVTAGATPTIVAANGVDYEITGLATAITSMSTNLSGTTTNGAIIEIDITDNATPQGLTFGTSFESTTVTLPTTTVASTRLRLFFQYNSTSGKWSLIGMA